MKFDNLQQIGKGFAFCISKTNLRAPDDVKAVQQKIAEQLEDDFDYTGQIALLDMDGGNNLKNILTAVNPDELFKLLFIDELRENYTGLIQSINVKISTLNQIEKKSKKLYLPCKTACKVLRPKNNLQSMMSNSVIHEIAYLSSIRLSHLQFCSKKCDWLIWQSITKVHLSAS